MILEKILSCGEENGQARRGTGECCIIKEEQESASCRVGGGPGEEQVMRSVQCCSGQGPVSTARKLQVHRGRIWISSSVGKQNCAFDSRGLRKGKRDIKGCFKKSSGCPETGAEGI